MLGDIEQTPASTRPKYGLEAPSDDLVGGNPLKKAALLGLLALASSLLLVIPDHDEQQYALEASTDAVDLNLDGAGADGSVDDRAATPGSVKEVAGDTGVSSDADTARLALATEAALSGAEHSVNEGSAIVSFASRMEAARAAAAAFAGTSTTALTTTAPPTTARPKATAAPTVAETTSSSTASTEPATTATEAPSSTAAVEESTPDPAAETTAPDPAGPTATVPETTAAPETTAPATTAPATTAANDGWVDSGNGVQLPKVLLAIRYCESRDNYGAANPASSARGAYQFLTGSWAAYGHRDRYGVSQAHLASPAQQDEAALITWKRDGTRPWNASKSCWTARL